MTAHYQVSPITMNPLHGHPRYKLVRTAVTSLVSLMSWVRAPPPQRVPVQIKELNSGTFGQVVLAQDTKTNKKVAVKLMMRGNGVRNITITAQPACNLHAPNRRSVTMWNVNS